MLNKTNLNKMLKESEDENYFQELTGAQVKELESLSLFLHSNIRSYRTRYCEK